MALSNTTASPWRSSEFTYDVAVIGLGEVGLPTALAYYAGGRTVVGIDISTDRLISIGAGLTNLVDSDRQRLDDALYDDRFQLTADLTALANARSVVICVPTPVDEFFAPDLAPLKEACAAVAEHAQKGQLLMLTATTYVGCTVDLLVRPLVDRGMEVGKDVFIAFSAERIEPGDTTAEQEAVPRVVGGATPACAARAAETLGTFATDVQEVPSLAIAEMSKLLENTFRALHVAVANEFADVSRSMKLDNTGRRLSARS